MNPRRPLVKSLALVLLLAMGTSAAETKPQTSQVGVTLLAEHSALVPGKTTTLAVAFKIEPGWHIYWQNPSEGDVGQGTTIEWQVPPGYQVGVTRFPPPKVSKDETGVRTFILQGEPAMLAELSVPASARPGEKATIGARVNWLACEKACVPGSKQLSIELPVVADESKVEIREPLAFKAARRELPAVAGSAKYLSGLSAVASVDKVRPGDKFEVRVVVEVQADCHVNSHTPLSKDYIPTELFVGRTPGLVTGPPVFPPGQIEQPSAPTGMPPAVALSGLEALSVYRGKTTIRIPVEAGDSLAGESLRIGGVVTYQACSDVEKRCYPPLAAEWSLTLPVGKAGEAVKVADWTPIEQTTTRPTSQPANDRARPPASAPAPATTGTQSGGGIFGFFLRIEAALGSFGTVGYIVLAFLGGLLLNLMPCVLPVISIKILSFVQQAKESRLRVLTLGLAFASGIQVSFIVLGLLILGLLKGAGLEIQWGGFFQSPVAVITFAAVVMALALSLFGVFTLSPPKFVLDMGGQVSEEGHVNAFAMGLLATLLGTACTAPLVSGAVAWALGQRPVVGMLIFVFMGLGMALPYILLAAKPAWLKFVPRPGPWMETFEHVMGFILLGTVVFLLNTVAHQLGGSGLVWTIVFLLCVAAAAWCYGRAGAGASTTRQAVCYSGTVVLIVAGWWLCFRLINTIPGLMARERALQRAVLAQANLDWPNPDEIPWLPYDRQRIFDLARTGKTVFVDYTATWCVNCNTNEIVAINTAEVRAAMRQMGVVPIRADFTSQDPEMLADLQRFGSGAVPLNMIIPANHPDEPIVLGVLLTPTAVLEGLRKAGPSMGATAPYSIAPAD